MLAIYSGEVGERTMITANKEAIVEQAQKIYADRLQVQLERDHRDRFVAIEPVSGDHFLGDTLIDAALSARSRYPDRAPYLIRIGHAAVYHIGGVSK
jgi:hypothetical protein